MRKNATCCGLNSPTKGEKINLEDQLGNWYYFVIRAVVSTFEVDAVVDYRPVVDILVEKRANDGWFTQHYVTDTNDIWVSW